MPSVYEFKTPSEQDQNIEGIIRIEGGLSSEQVRYIVKILWMPIRESTDMLVMMEQPRQSPEPGKWKLYFILNTVKKFSVITDGEKRAIMADAMYRFYDKLEPYLVDIEQGQIQAALGE